MVKVSQHNHIGLVFTSALSW